MEVCSVIFVCHFKFDRKNTKKSRDFGGIHGLLFVYLPSKQTKENFMGAAKWIGGILGFMSGGPLGALAGYAIGALFESAADMSDDRQTTQAEGEKYSFRFSLMVMTSYIIQADGRIMHSEMEYVRAFLRNSFGEEAAREGNDILLRLFEQRKQMDQTNPQAYKQTIRECAVQLSSALTYEQRLQLLAFLCGIAKADGKVSPEEVAALKEVAMYMQMAEKEVDSMLNLGGDSLEEAYKVLEVSPDATDQEVRAAYRALALKHHPDKVAMLGDDVKRAAEEKFQQINNAKEKIYKARGMK
jgi:DnaJ like chaperone protein